MISSYIKVLKLLETSAAAINSYESLPKRVSPRTLITAPPEKDEVDEQYENQKEYPFETVDTIHQKLSPKPDKY